MAEASYPFYCVDSACWAKALPGQVVTIRGLCETGGLLWWSIVDVKGEPPPTMTVGQFAKEIEKDDRDLETKRKEPAIILEGTLEAVAIDPVYKTTILKLTPETAKTKIEANLMGDFEPYAKKHDLLKVGQPIRLVGKWSVSDKLSNSIVLPAKSSQ